MSPMSKIILQLLLILCAAPVFGQSIRTLDDQVADVLAREYPEWKIEGGRGAFKSDGGMIERVPSQSMYGTWLDGQRRLYIRISVINRPGDPFRWFFSRQVIPPTRQLTGIGNKAFLVETTATTEIAFTKENLFVTIETYFPPQPGTKIRSTYLGTAPKAEVERISAIAQSLDKMIVSKRTMSECYNDFYSPVFPRPTTDSERLLAASWIGDPATVKIMIAAGISTEVTDSDGNTPLLLAMRSGCIETVRTLIEARANLNARNLKQQTPLMIAASQRQLEAARLLISSGADAKAKDKYGRNTEFYVSNGYSEIDLFP